MTTDTSPKEVFSAVYTHNTLSLLERVQEIQATSEKNCELAERELFTGHFLSLHCNHANNLVKRKVNSKKK